MIAVAGFRLTGFLLAVLSAALVCLELRQAEMQETARKVIAQKPPSALSVENLTSLATADMVLQANFTKGRAILSLFLAERCVVVGDRKRLDHRLSLSAADLVEALRLNPFDGNLWLMAYWVQVLRNGPSAYGNELLNASYVTSPYEGWIAMRRSRLAWAVFPLLPPDLQGKVLFEFVAFLRANYFDHAVSLVTGPAWPYREELLSRLDDLPVASRLLFSVKLQRLGYFLPVKGVVLPEIRPWRRTCSRNGPGNRGGVCL